jgi:hypothetical protein
MDDIQRIPVQGTPSGTSPAAAAAEDLKKLTEEPTESMADLVEEFEEKQEDFQAMYDAGGSFAKQLGEIAGSFRKGGIETEPVSIRKDRAVEKMEEIPVMPEVEKKLEQEGYIQKVEKEAETQQIVVDDYTQQVLLKPAVTQSPRIILPLTQEEVQKGLHQKVWESIRWLAEWCIRQVRMLAGRAEYKKGN